MVGCYPVIRDGGQGRVQYAGQERHHLVRPIRELFRAGFGRWVIVEWMRQVVAEHAGAGAGKDHNVVISVERRDNLLPDRLRRASVTAVKCWLPAARLRARDLYHASRTLQQLDGCKPNRGAM